MCTTSAQVYSEDGHGIPVILVIPENTPINRKACSALMILIRSLITHSSRVEKDSQAHPDLEPSVFVTPFNLSDTELRAYAYPKSSGYRPTQAEEKRVIYITRFRLCCTHTSTSLHLEEISLTKGTTMAQGDIPTRLDCQAIAQDWLNRLQKAANDPEAFRDLLLSDAWLRGTFHTWQEDAIAY